MQRDRVSSSWSGTAETGKALPCCTVPSFLSFFPPLQKWHLFILLPLLSELIVFLLIYRNLIAKLLYFHRLKTIIQTLFRYLLFSDVTLLCFCGCAELQLLNSAGLDEHNMGSYYSVLQDSQSDIEHQSRGNSVGQGSPERSLQRLLLLIYVVITWEKKI